MASKDQILFAETFAALQSTLKRKNYDSDSDSTIDATTNRGNKLKKRARYVRQGQLAPATAPTIYEEVVDHGGYHRAIISRNPPLIDEDGYNIESDDDEEHVQDALAAAAEQNPYTGIRLEHILAPLTSAADLPQHPSLSRPFTSKALTELTTQGLGWMHKENAALWNVKPLLTRLCGDYSWACCDKLTANGDARLFGDDTSDAFGRHPRANGTGPDPSHGVVVNGDSESNADEPSQAANKDQSSDAERRGTPDAKTPQTSTKDASPVNGVEKDPANDGDAVHGDKQASTDKELSAENGADSSDRVESRAPERRSRDTGQESQQTPDKTEVSDSDVRMTDSEAQQLPSPEPQRSDRATSAAAAVIRRGSVTPPAIADVLPIHPLYVAPRSAHPDRNAGMPEQEAEDVRRLLQLWVQKQEEVTRGTAKLYEGLLKAERLRNKVLEWAKAEAHVGEMSDGEDWYDKEAWGLTEDLKKGQDEEEEDTTQQPQKKTRSRK